MAELRVIRHEGLVPYETAWEEQRRLHAARVAGEIDDTVVLLEHEPVYTAGKRTKPSDRPLPGSGAPVVDVDRGGEITWHGPGQIVGYPILALPERVDVIGYVRRVEQLMIDVCAELGVDGVRVDGRSGVWIPADGRGPERKIGAVGLRVAQGVSMHGFALNCNCDLTWYDRIVPCGISDAATTSLAREAGRDVTVAEVLPHVERHLDDVLALQPHA
ncbi:lipoyl(octanoyl) transferase LipB [Haloactinopolyspora alba]|uniref:lipoyl(octanoyl) transferase LipB n=1 Tax=Haloactinopolyspora alba TaxID=648780 RepID=UPI001FD5FCF7|nr:lipoyl(octanoyl) transferase LipB [Haloactinopolyspora alba]